MALALSGGGDSVALLHIAADWARENARRLLVLTVDHGLTPDSAAWTGFAERMALGAGADWVGLHWRGDKPATGLPAAARTARHALIADAARQAGARVVLFAHTATDIAESDLIREEGSTIGRLREWAPSPVWPEGRGLMLLRPMLEASRGAVRDWLAGKTLEWIDDPANADIRFARSRARAALEGGGPPASPAEPTARPTDATPVSLGPGVVGLSRTVSAATLAAALVCVGGGSRLPRGDRLAALLQRLRGGEIFTAVLAGARLTADSAGARVTREAGEFTRRPTPPLPLIPGVEAVWDGRWAITTNETGWSVVPAAGLRGGLSKEDRARLAALPRDARGAMPVLIRNGQDAAFLAREGDGAVSLVEPRLALALDTTPHEGALG